MVFVGVGSFDPGRNRCLQAHIAAIGIEQHGLDNVPVVRLELPCKLWSRVGGEDGRIGNGEDRVGLKFAIELLIDEDVRAPAGVTKLPRVVIGFEHRGEPHRRPERGSCAIVPGLDVQAQQSVTGHDGAFPAGQPAANCADRTCRRLTMHLRIALHGASNPTMHPPLHVPHLVEQRAESEGEVGRAWLDGLSSLTAELAARWDLVLGQPYEGGSAGYVTRATTSNGALGVLKISFSPSSEDKLVFARSVRAHQLAAGRGCAELLAHDADSHALLLERLGPNLDDLGLDTPDLMTTIASTLTEFWRPIPADSGLPTGADKARWLSDFIVDNWQQLHRPCDRAVIDRAVEYCETRAAAFDPSKAVLVHGDAHGWNTVSAGSAFKFVDPEGLLSERAHDLGVPMREYNGPLLAGDTQRLTWQRAETLAQLCDADPQPVWEWGFIERVATGLANLLHFEGDEGQAFLEVARRCL